MNWNAARGQVCWLLTWLAMILTLMNPLACVKGTRDVPAQQEAVVNMVVWDGPTRKLIGRQVLRELVRGIDTAPRRDITLERYNRLKAERDRIVQRLARTGQPDKMPHLWLVAFDESSADVGWVVRTGRRNMGLQCNRVYRLARSHAVDDALHIPQAIEQRTRVIGGVYYGMTVRELFAKKGRPHNESACRIAGHALLYYADVRVDVRRYPYGGDGGRVVYVRPAREGSE